MKMKKYLLGVVFTNLSVFCFGQQNLCYSISSYGMNEQPSFSVIRSYEQAENHKFTNLEFDGLFTKDEKLVASNLPGLNWEISRSDFGFRVGAFDSEIFTTNTKNEFMKPKTQLGFNYPTSKKFSLQNDNFFEKNRRNIYSSMWAFASLNYLYCDLVAFMDKDIHSQYHTGMVDGTNMTPQFLTGAAVMMQIAIANVFLPQVIKNDRTLRWVQIASGVTMTLLQSATLFVGKPTPYYATFSALEIGATTFIAINAIKWKTNPKKQLPVQY
jgi:hypothetical protein